MFGQHPAICRDCRKLLCTCTTPVVEAECDALEGEGRTAEVVEADIRRVMAEHAKILARGWQTERDRLILHQRVDRLLDEHAMLLEIEELTS